MFHFKKVQLIPTTLAILLLLSGCTTHARSTDSSNPSTSTTQSSSTSTPSSSSSVIEQDASMDESNAENNTSEVPSVEPVVYDFSSPVPESDPVDTSYFEDAAFIGDSRTDGFMIYSGIGCGDNLTANGLSIFKIMDEAFFKIDGQSCTLAQALERKQYGKIYLSLGVNELGYYDDKGFYKAYCETIDLIREVQPHAVIYIQGLIPLNEDVIASTGGASYLKNDKLCTYNDLMKQVAEEKQVAYLDLYSEFVQDDGQLPADASTDGVHLRKAYCEQWLTYLENHTVSYEALYGSEEV